MTRFTIVVLPDAEANMRVAFLWYFDKSPLAADAFGTEVGNAIDGLEETAGDWPKDEDGVRVYHLKHFPYTLRYEPMCATRPSAPAKLVRDVSCVGDPRQSGLVEHPDQIAASRDLSLLAESQRYPNT